MDLALATVDEEVPAGIVEVEPEGRVLPLIAT